MKEAALACLGASIRRR